MKQKIHPMVGQKMIFFNPLTITEFDAPQVALRASQLQVFQQICYGKK